MGQNSIIEKFVFVSTWLFSFSSLVNSNNKMYDESSCAAPSLSTLTASAIQCSAGAEYHTGAEHSPYQHLLLVNDIRYDGQQQNFVTKEFIEVKDGFRDRLFSVWGIKPQGRWQQYNKTDCEESYDAGYVLPVNESDSYHGLLFHVLLTLHATINMELRHETGVASRLLMPAIVKASRSFTISVNKNTVAFYDDEGRHVMELVRRFAGGLYFPLPLDIRLKYMNKSICIKRAQFGLPQYGHLLKDGNVLRNYVTYMKNNLNLVQYDREDNVEQKTLSNKTHIGILTHNIVNNGEIASALKHVASGRLETELITFNITDNTRISFYAKIHSLSSTLDVLVGATSGALSVGSLLPQRVAILHLLTAAGGSGSASQVESELTTLLTATRRRSTYHQWRNDATSIGGAVRVNVSELTPVILGISES